VGLPGEGSRSLFVFQLADLLFAIDPGSIRRVVALPLLSRPPGTPPQLHGFLNLEGEAVPVLDLRRLFQLADEAPDVYAHLILVQRSPIPLALLVDRAIGLADADAEAFCSLSPGQTFNDCAEQAVQMANQTVHLLSVEKLLLREERGRIAALAGIEQRRLRQLEDATP
jgi:purine-binding chemotaxis protein CheW